MKKSELTRLHILEKAFELIYSKGYQVTSVDDILATTEVTKGAFYYHFKNKDEMGVAIINELIKPNFENIFIKPLLKEGNAVDALYNMMQNVLVNNKTIKLDYGCPAANLTLEMAPWNIDFTNALNELVTKWKVTIEMSIERGKTNNELRKDIDSEEIAVFIMSGYWGIRNLGRLNHSKQIYFTYLQHFKKYLASLM